jgi:hypothetical protein
MGQINWASQQIGQKANDGQPLKGIPPESVKYRLPDYCGTYSTTDSPIIMARTPRSRVSWRPTPRLLWHVFLNSMIQNFDKRSKPDTWPNEKSITLVTPPINISLMHRYAGSVLYNLKNTHTRKYWVKHQSRIVEFSQRSFLFYRLRTLVDRQVTKPESVLTYLNNKKKNLMWY